MSKSEIAEKVESATDIKIIKRAWLLTEISNRDRQDLIEKLYKENTRLRERVSSLESCYAS